MSEKLDMQQWFKDVLGGATRRNPQWACEVKDSDWSELARRELELRQLKRLMAMFPDEMLEAIANREVDIPQIVSSLTAR